MKISIVNVGKKNTNPFEKQVSSYVQKINVLVHCEWITLPSIEGHTDRNYILEKESQKIIAYLAKIPKAFLVCLDEKGTAYHSENFADYVHQLRLQAQHGVFLIGSSYGLHPQIKSLAQKKISLSAMTLPHEIALLLFAEQLYRATTILQNKKYHHG